MSAETLLDEFIEFRNEHNDHWPEGLISVEIDGVRIKLEFELNIQSQSFFEHEFEGVIKYWGKDYVKREPPSFFRQRPKNRPKKGSSYCCCAHEEIQKTEKEKQRTRLHRTKKNVTKQIRT
jgi:hypothetical protein